MWKKEQRVVVFSQQALTLRLSVPLAVVEGCARHSSAALSAAFFAALLIASIFCSSRPHFQSPFCFWCRSLLLTVWCTSELCLFSWVFFFYFFAPTLNKRWIGMRTMLNCTQCPWGFGKMWPHLCNHSVGYSVRDDTLLLSVWTDFVYACVCVVRCLFRHEVLRDREAISWGSAGDNKGWQ